MSLAEHVRIAAWGKAASTTPRHGAGCECADPGCPAHKGKSACVRSATERVYRVDMEDRTGTRVCEKCEADCMESGLFANEPNFYSR